MSRRPRAQIDIDFPQLGKLTIFDKLGDLHFLYCSYPGIFDILIRNVDHQFARKLCGVIEAGEEIKEDDVRLIEDALNAQAKLVFEIFDFQNSGANPRRVETKAEAHWLFWGLDDEDPWGYT